jgi:hypothetical protein
MTNPQTYAARIRAIWTKPGWTMYDFIRDINALAAEADAKLAEAEKRIGELEAVVGKLPRTADGVPIVPEMTLYRTHMGDQQEKLTVRRFNLIHGLNGAEWWVFTYEHMAGFPARELSAALASRPGKEEGGK